MMPYIISLAFSVLYVSMQTLSIYAGDSGKLVAAAYTWSIAHPPGYPLYMLLGGIVTHSFPFSTVAWRMGLLSSLFMAGSLFFVWKIIFYQTKSAIGASFGSILYGLLYPVWLYATIPEVFGLFSFFSSLILYIFLLYLETKKIKWFFFLSFLFGLSLTHHHLILLLLLSIGSTLFSHHRKLLLSLKPYIITILICFFLGFSFYLYAPVVSSGYPPFDWEHPASIEGFLRLITRASYGTFKASYTTGQSLLDRVLNEVTFFQFALKDISLIGLFLAVIGLTFFWKRKRFLFSFYSIYGGFLLFFFFYAGFPVNSDFSIGTMERFFIIPYQLIAILSGIGLFALLSSLRSLWGKHKRNIQIPFWIIKIIVIIILVMLCTRLFRSSYVKIILLRNDRTLEKLADDIFASVPPNGILNLSDDTSSFAVDYSYYVLKKRQDIRYISFPMLQFDYYHTWIKKHFPDVLLPSFPKPVLYEEYFAKFLQLNYPIRPILSEKVEVTVSDYWVPRGLVVMYYPSLEEIPERGLTLGKNLEFWKSFQDPFQGVLGRYKHLMMTDVLRYYSDKRLTLAQAFLLYGNMESAELEMNEAIRLTPDRIALYLPYIQLLIKQNKCEDALIWVQKTETKFINPNEVVGIYHQLYGECDLLQERLQEKENEYLELTKKFGKPIE